MGSGHGLASNSRIGILDAVTDHDDPIIAKIQDLQIMEVFVDSLTP